MFLILEFIVMFVSLKFNSIVYLLLLLSILLLFGDIEMNSGPGAKSNNCTAYIIIFEDSMIILKIFKSPVI